MPFLAILGPFDGFSNMYIDAALELASTGTVAFGRNDCPVSVGVGLATPNRLEFFEPQTAIPATRYPGVPGERANYEKYDTA